MPRFGIYRASVGGWLPGGLEAETYPEGSALAEVRRLWPDESTLVMQEPMGWWTVIVDGVRQRTCDHDGHLYQVGPLSLPHARVLAGVLKGRVHRAAPIAYKGRTYARHDGREYFVVLGLGVEGQMNDVEARQHEAPLAQDE